MSNETDYARSLRYFKRTIKNLSESVITKASRPITASNVVELQNDFEELQSVFEEYKRCYRMQFSSISEETDAAQLKAEDALAVDLDALRKLFNSASAKAKPYITEYNELTRDVSLSINAGNTSISAGVRLPKIEIPDFDGNSESFLEFSAIFENLVHNEFEIPKVRKLVLLKRACKAGAHDLIKHIPLTDSGYTQAWELIQSTYRNMKSIIRKHFDNLFSTPKIKNASEIPELFANIEKSLKGLQACSVDIKHWSLIISYIVSERLDKHTYEEFEKTLQSNAEFPSWELLREFLHSRCSMTKRKTDNTENPTTSNRTIPSKRRTAGSSTSVAVTSKQGSRSSSPTSNLKCVVCTQPHLLINCRTFIAKTPRERYDLLKSTSICRNCFKSNHKTTECTKSPNCRECKLPHHTMLHFGNEKPARDSTTKPVIESAASVACTSHPIEPTTSTSCLSVRKPVVLLPTAVVKFRTGNKTGEMRVLLDSCSQLNLITSSFVNRHHLPSSPSKYCQRVAGVTDHEEVCDRITRLSIESRTQSFRFDTSFTVLSTALPYSVHNLHIAQLSADLSNYKLADPAYYQSLVNIPEIDAILGIEAYDRIVCGDVLKIGTAVLRNTTLGWTLSSAVHTINNQPKPDTSLLCCSVDQIDAQLQRFWEIESIPTISESSAEATACDNHFEETHSFDADGRFILRLPFRTDPTGILNNYVQVRSYANRFESRLTEPIASLYHAFMQEYLDLGHMSLVEEPNVTERYFIPHHAVLKPSSTTTQLRVVFNASYKTRSAVSLNDVLMIGANMQPEVFDVLSLFRRFRYAASADVAKFYRCIWIYFLDRIFQSIIWRDLIYELNTVTYGTGPASYQASMCMEKLARKYEKSYPLIAYIIRKCRYMDDFMFGADTIEELIELVKLLHDILASSGFNLRKYQSNSNAVLQSIDPTLIETKLSKTIGGDDSLLILGMIWVPTLDVFQLKTDFGSVAEIVTKRIILSTISKLFDPLGFASPVLIRGKLMFQRLWKLGASWDQPLNEDITAEFHSYIADLNEIQHIEYPRFVGKGPDDRIVGFSDASEHAYCAVIYIVTVDQGIRKATLFCSKTRVAPVKPLTIPQLELQAATLLSDLVDRVRTLLPVPDNHVYLFTDSTIVLSWLSRPPNDWKVFVRNRVTKIVSHYPPEFWNHVSGKLNPADLATRGLTSKQLSESSLWQYGPEFIVQDEIVGSSFDIDDRCKTYLSKPKSALLVTEDNQCDIHIIESYSSYSKLTRMYATVRAAIRHWHAKPLTRLPFKVTVDDITFAENHLIRIVQRNGFPEEFQRLSSNRNRISKRSRLLQHNPFLDNYGIIRSRTRLQYSDFSYDRRNPLILPANCHFTTILVRHVHERYFHATHSFIIAYLSVKYLFVGGISRVVKSVVKRCVTCRRHLSKSIPQMMGSLPANRVTPNSPFEVVGVDFAGAFTVKCDHHRTTKHAKAYAAIFVCFSSRAVHIEIVPSLSTADFIHALKCFVARRGRPTTIYSDNGTNFKGADNYLNFNTPEISEYAIDQRIKWVFNPPYTPHRGGIWEAAVKSAKRFLPIVTKGQLFTYNELRVLLTEIEAILNSRPLIYTSLPDSTNEVLTPGHFLIGRNLTSISEPVTNQSMVKLSDQYKANRNRCRDFWRLWSVDYINQLRSRSKWFNPEPNFVVGQIVLYRQPNYPVLEWPLARIDRCLPDSIGIVRTVEIRVNGQLKRVPTQHLTYLPVDQPDSTSSSSTNSV